MKLIRNIVDVDQCAFTLLCANKWVVAGGEWRELLRRGRDAQKESGMVLKKNAEPPALERFRSLLHERGQRWTPEREAIAEALLTCTGHFSVEALVADLRARGIAASRATVYRSLPLLVDAGLLQPTLLSKDGVCYETSMGQPHHDHLVCQRCGTVIEFQFEAFEMLQAGIAAKYGFELVGHIHELIGICPDCRAPEPSDGSAAPSTKRGEA
jgi:Fur family transcriptional regulator, ferric uptake regulator